LQAHVQYVISIKTNVPKVTSSTLSCFPVEPDGQ